MASLRGAGVQAKLKIVGRGDDLARLEDAVGRQNLGEVVEFLGFVDEEEKRRLLRRALAVVFPSAKAGWGTVNVEAAASGTPVITSNTSALPETAGDAALLVDPTSREAIAAAMHSILDEPALNERLREAGLRRAASFSWKRTAEATLSVYRSVIEGAPGRKGDAARQGAAV